MEKTKIFAELSPRQKAKIIEILQKNGHSVGFMGDGMNDLSAELAANVGISVDTAADAVKESADVILLKKDLNVLERSILEGRKAFVNMTKYIKITASSNFGNIFAVVIASILLPFFPMTSLQLLLLNLLYDTLCLILPWDSVDPEQLEKPVSWSGKHLGRFMLRFGPISSVFASALLPFLPMMSIHLIFLNLIYDLSCTAIPWDNVDEEFISVPRKWDASSVGSFMIWIGPTSSVFDITTYIFMYFVFCPMFVSGGVLYNDLAMHFTGAELEAIQFQYMAMFQAGWFVESMWSQTLVIHMIRTPKLPFIQSHASAPLTLMTMTGIAVLTIIPFTPLGTLLGFVALPASYFLYLIPCILLYMLLATVMKKAYVHHYGELL